MSDFQPQADQQAAPAPAPEKPIDFLSDRTFRLPSQNPQTGLISYVQVSVQNNCIRFAADISADASGTWASLLLPKTEWGMFKISLQRIATAKEPTGETFRCYVGGQQDRRLDATIRVGRDAEGIVSLTMSDANNLSKKFDFKLGPNTEIVDDNGQPLPANEISRRRAIAWMAETSPMVDEEFKKKFATFEQRQAANNGGNGGGGNGGFKKQWNGGGQGNGGGGFKKQWNGGNNQNQNGGFKKQWNNNGGGNGGQGGGFKKPWQGQGGGQNNGFKKPWQGGGQGGGQQQQQYTPQYQQQAPQQQSSAPEPTISFDQYMP